MPFWAHPEECKVLLVFWTQKRTRARPQPRMIGKIGQIILVSYIILVRGVIGMIGQIYQKYTKNIPKRTPKIYQK